MWDRQVKGITDIRRCGKPYLLNVLFKNYLLSYAEYYSAVGGDKENAFDEYAFYGGMPLVLSRPNDTAKENYLSSPFSEVYIKDIVERKKIKREDVLDQLPDLPCSSVNLLTDLKKIADTLRSKTEQELNRFFLTSDSFLKIVVRRDIRKRWYNDSSVLNIGLMDFLLDDSVI